MNQFHTRPVKEEDFLAISEIAAKCSPMATERNSIYHIFTKFFKKTSLVVETKEKIPIGFLLGFISQDNPQDAYIHLLCIIPQYRMKGLAKFLVGEFMDIVSEKGCSKVYLITSPQNKKAINFYQSMGFKVNNSGGEEVVIDGINTFKDYNGPGEHKVIFSRILQK